MTRKAKRAARAKPAPGRQPRGLVTRRELAARLPNPGADGKVGVHMMTVTKWEREGMPIAKRGSRGRPSYYREVDVRAWLQLREEAAKQTGGGNPLQDRARKDRAQAALAEQAYLIRMRDLLPREEVEKAWAAEINAVRTLLLGWPTTLADKIARAYTVDGIGGVERVLNEAVRDVLRELSDPDRPPSTSEPPGGTAVAA